MRVAYVLKMYPRFSETFILQELLELERQGVEVRVFSLKRPNDGVAHADVSRLRGPVVYVPDSPLGLARALRPRHLPRLARLVARRRWTSLKHFLRAAWIAPRLDGITHVHAHFASTATSVALHLHRIAGVTYSFTAHAKDIYLDTVQGRDLARKLESARFAVTISDFNLRHLEPLAGPAPLHRIYNGLDLELFSRNGAVPDEPPLILAVGRLIEKKGFDDLVHACALLERHEVPFRCLIVGKGQLEGSLRALVADLELGDRVELPGPVPREELLALYQRAAVVVAPCVVGSDGNRDGLPTVLIEAMALGVPVISTPVTGIPELVEHAETGLLVPERSPEALAAALRAVLADPHGAAELARRGRTRVEEAFDLRRNVAQLRRLFEEATA